MTADGAGYTPLVRISVVLPCYNEEENIAGTVQSVLAWMKESGVQGEVIAVNDGSADGTGRLLAEMERTEPRLQVITHDRNQGYGAAVRSGCDAATQEVIAFMDSDGQFRIEDIALLLPHLEQYRFVAGRRRKRADPLFRRVYGKVLGVANFLAFHIWIRDVNCGFKVFRRSLWPVIRPEYGVEKLLNTEMFWRLKRAGIPWVQVDVPHYPRIRGNPTGAKLYVIGRMFREMRQLRRAMAIEGGRRGQ